MEFTEEMGKGDGRFREIPEKVLGFAIVKVIPEQFWLVRTPFMIWKVMGP